MMKIKRNLHTIDRGTRLVVGVAATYFGFVDPSIIGNDLVTVLVGLFGVINLFAFFTAHCPVYGVTGFSTYNGPRTKTRTDESAA